MGSIRNYSELPTAALLSVTLVVFVLGLAVLSGCSNGSSSTTKPAAPSSSVPDLLAKLANLKQYSVESCEHTTEKSTSSGGLPSPSDIRLELKGSAVLSDEGSKALMSAYAWKPVKRDDVPRALVAILPPGNVLASDEFNESFGQNTTYVHGAAAIIEGDTARRVYFVASDIDHPIR